MKFDEFLDTINDFGRYQKLRYFCICLTYMLPPIMVYTWSFAAATPGFRCKLSSNDSDYHQAVTALSNHYQPDEAFCKANAKVSVKECQRCYMKVQSTNELAELKSCEDYVYERSYHQYTLVEEWSMVCDRTVYRSAVQNLFFFGYMVGSILFGILSDKYGRRPIMSLCIVLMACTGFICAFFPQKELFGFWPSYSVYTLSRFILACSTRGIAVTGFVLATELVGPNNKFLTAIIVQYFFATGQLILVSFAYFIREWRLLTLVLSIFTLPFTLSYFVLPESARWMISKRRYSQAEKLLRKMAKINDRKFDELAFEQLKAEQDQHSEAGTHNVGVLSLFKSKIMCIISINLFFQWFVQNLVFYGVSQSTGSWGFDPYLSFTISACVEILSYVVLHLTLNRVGRKWPYFVAVLLFATIALLTIPVQSLMTKNSPEQKVLSFIMNVSLKFFAAGSYAIIYIYANELFPTGIRNTGMGICSMIARIGAIVGTTSNDILGRLWINLPTVLFGILSLIAAFLVLILPETLNKSLPQTIEDTERMGLVCVPIRRRNRRGSIDEEKKAKENQQEPNEDRVLSDLLKSADDS